MITERDQAIAALYEREYERLCAAAYRAMGDKEAAEDLVQDTFLLALLHREELPGHPAPEAWLLRTLRNLIQNERRKLAVRATVPLEDLDGLPAALPPLSLKDVMPSGLSEKDQELLILRFERKLSYREIGAIFGISEGAGRIRLFRAVEKCKKLLEK